jgi:glycosyltransferase involved in cell wall biosynthesis
LQKFRLHFGTNNGAGAARNYGFDQAGGKFICYVDSDDWIEPNLCSDMLLALNESGADFVNFGLDFFNNDGKILITKEKFSRKTLQGENIFRKAMLDDDILTVVWNKVYRRSFFIEKNIQFTEVK